MAVESTSYGTVVGIQARVGDVVPSRTFSSSTVPTTTQVEGFIDDIASELNAELDNMGYTVPVTEAAFPHTFQYLKMVNEKGASADVMDATGHSTTIGPQGQEVSSGRYQEYRSAVFHAIKKIRKNQLKAARTVGTLGNVKAGARLDSDSNIKKPSFKRGQWRHPNTVPIIESDT